MAPPTLPIPVGPQPTKIYTPAPVGKPHLFMQNFGPSTVYVGGPGVTANSGLPLRGGESIDYPVGFDAVYAACSGLTLSGTVLTNVSTAVTGGTSTKVSVAATTGFAANQLVQLGTGNNSEVLKVSSLSSGPSLIFTSQPTYDHTAGAAVTQVTGGATGTVRVYTGTT